MKPIIIAIVGPSGSGKTTLALHLQKQGIPSICSYTTRPIRDGEENGREHWFVSQDRPIPQEPLAYTFFGGQHYWAEHSQVTSLCSYVIDEKGLVELKEKWSDRYNIFSVYIKRDKINVDFERIARDFTRSTLDDQQYNLIISNTSNLDGFLKQATSLIKFAVRQINPFIL